MDWEDIIERAVKTFRQSAIAAVPTLVVVLDTVEDWKAAILGLGIAGFSAAISFVGNTLRVYFSTRESDA